MRTFRNMLCFKAGLIMSAWVAETCSHTWFNFISAYYWNCCVWTEIYVRFNMNRRCTRTHFVHLPGKMLLSWGRRQCFASKRGEVLPDTRCPIQTNKNIHIIIMIVCTIRSLCPGAFSERRILQAYLYSTYRPLCEFTELFKWPFSTDGQEYR